MLDQRRDDDGFASLAIGIGIRFGACPAAAYEEANVGFEVAQVEEPELRA